MEQAVLSNPRCQWRNWHWDVEWYLFKIIQLMSLSPRIQVFWLQIPSCSCSPTCLSFHNTEKTLRGGVISFHCLYFLTSQTLFTNLASSSLLPCTWSYTNHWPPHPGARLHSHLTWFSEAFKVSTPSLKPFPFLASIKHRLLVSLLLQ